MRLLAGGIRDSQGQAGSGFENLALRDTGFSILLSGIRDLNRILRVGTVVAKSTVCNLDMLQLHVFL